MDPLGVGSSKAENKFSRPNLDQSDGANMPHAQKNSLQLQSETGGMKLIPSPRYVIWVCLKMLCTPLYPMVFLIIIPMKNGYFIGGIPNIFRQTHINMSI